MTGFGAGGAAVKILVRLGVGFESERRRKRRLRADRGPLRGYEIAFRLRGLELRRGDIRARRRAVADLCGDGSFVYLNSWTSCASAFTVALSSSTV